MYMYVDDIMHTGSVVRAHVRVSLKSTSQAGRHAKNFQPSRDQSTSVIWE